MHAPNRCERQQKTSCVMETGSLTICLYALFVFSAEGKVYMHLIVIAEMRDPLVNVNSYLRPVIDTLQGSSCYREVSA